MKGNRKFISRNGRMSTVGFLTAFGLILASGLAPLFVLSMVILFQWFGYVIAISTFVIPWYIVNKRRNGYRKESKDFSRSEKALDWIIQEVKKKNDNEN